MKNILVLGASGFIGSHLARRLRQDGHRVIGIDCRRGSDLFDRFYQVDLRQKFPDDLVHEKFDEVYHLAANMGGAGYIYDSNHDFDILNSDLRMHLNVVEYLSHQKSTCLFFASSACVYPANLRRPCKETDAYPASPDSNYGWQKLFAERFLKSACERFGFGLKIARLHNVYGPGGAWNNGREKAPAAICRKIAKARPRSEIEIWGSGQQVRSFLYIDDCIEGMLRLMASAYSEPLNIGSERAITIQELADIILQISGKKDLQFKYIAGPTGVDYRCSDNTLASRHLEWAPSCPLELGLRQTYQWVDTQLSHESNRRISEATL